MSVRTSLPPSLSSPVLRQSGEGVTFRLPESGQPYASPRGSTLPSQSFSNGSNQSIRSTQQSVPATSQDVSRQLEEKKAPSKSFVKGYRFQSLAILIIVLILVYVSIYLILYVSNLNMVTDLVNGERVRNPKKLLLWTSIIGSVFAAILIFGYTKYYK